jgi:hypothetical protein
MEYLGIFGVSVKTAFALRELRLITDNQFVLSLILLAMFSC